MKCDNFSMYLYCYISVRNYITYLFLVCFLLQNGASVSSIAVAPGAIAGPGAQQALSKSVQSECGRAVLGIYMGVPRFGVSEKISQEKCWLRQGAVNQVRMFQKLGMAFVECLSLAKERNAVWFEHSRCVQERAGASPEASPPSVL